jgi:signal transduction histidine kinase/CheY-like chemotaxis protein
VATNRRTSRWWDNLRLSTKGYIVIGIPIVCAVVITVTSLILSAQVSGVRGESAQITADTNDLNQKLLQLVDAETGVRGYAATDNPAFLQPYFQALASLTPVLTNTGFGDGLTAQEAAQLKSLTVNELNTLNHVRAGVVDGTLRGLGLDAALVKGKTSMDQIRSAVAAVQKRQQALVTNDQNRLNRTRLAARVVDIVGLIVAVLGGLAAMLLFTSGVANRIKRVGRNARHLGREEPLDPIPPSRDAIGELELDLEHAATLLDQRNAELREARDLAVAATHAKDEFLSHMSHELRTPLTSILGFGQLMQMEDLGEENADSVDHIVRAGTHLLALINEVLDIARIESGNLGLSMEPILVSEVVDDSVSLLQPLAQSHSIVVEVRDLQGVLVTADHQRLKQVLLNLLSNAIKYNRDEGRVTVTATPSDPGRVRIVVTDTGIGIPADSVDRLFIPFDRIHNAHSPIEGTGVGLSLSKALVEAMDGTIGVETEDGTGSSFWIELPRAEAHTDGPAVGSSAPDNGPKPGSGTVLYVEDNLTSLRVVERIFGRRGETLQVALQGGMALDLAREHHPRLILLDLHLPDMSGEEALRQLQADPATADIPVVILSADVSRGAVDRLLANGASAFLSKPINISELLVLLDNGVSDVADPTAGPTNSGLDGSDRAASGADDPLDG